MRFFDAETRRRRGCAARTSRGFRGGVRRDERRFWGGFRNVWTETEDVEVGLGLFALRVGRAWPRATATAQNG
jgi:hypothetical protein